MQVTNLLAPCTDDYTMRYWDLLRKVQQDMVPVFDKFKVTMDRLTGQQREEKLIKKMTGIYNILPRLKVHALSMQTSTYPPFET